MSNNGSNTLTRGLSVLGKLFVGSRKGPSGERVRRLKKLQKRIGVRFTDLSLLEQALTHRSYSHVTAQTRNDSNERMEFLGDSVLGLSVSQFLYLEFPDRSEGALSKMKSLLVSRKVLSTVSRLVGLGEYLLLSGEEADMGGRDRTSILADSFEGLIGAIYLDQGYRAANLFIRRTLLSDINEILKDEEHTNYKSLLQEYVQSRRLSHPVYRVRREEGPEHEKEFAVDVIVRGEPWGSGRGKSKKDAEQNAARSALERRQEKSSRSSTSRSARGESETRETRESPEARAEAREPRARRGRRSGENRPGRKTPPEAAPTTPSRPRGDHGVAASRERIRAQRSEDDGSSRRGEARSRRVSDRPVRERVTREPKETREPRVRERISSADADNDQARSPGEESTRRRRRRRGSRGGAGRSSSSESAEPKASSEAAGAITDGADAAPQEDVSADAGRADTRSRAPREGRRRRRERPRREEGAESPAESPEAEQEAPETPRREERARVRRAETAPRNEETAPADAPSAEVEAEPRRRGRSARRSSRPEPKARREPPAPETPPDVPESGPELEPVREGSEGSEGFARRKKRVVRGFGRR
ncbi:MAG TPA: ribonuclease III [bacterium]|nr:ribonuclease III [bacterium]